jgi:hypothetical protein
MTRNDCNFRFCIACDYRLFLEKHYGAMLLFKSGNNILEAFVFTHVTEETILVENYIRLNENYPLVLLCSEMCEIFLRYVGHVFRLVRVHEKVRMCGHLSSPALAAVFFLIIGRASVICEQSYLNSRQAWKLTECW